MWTGNIGTNRVRRAIQRVSVRWLGVKLNIMAWRNGSRVFIKAVEEEFRRWRKMRAVGMQRQ